MEMVIKALQDAGNFVQARAQEVGTVGKNVGYTFVCVTNKMSKEVGGTRAMVGSISATIGLINLWIAVSEPFQKLGETCDLANKGLGALHLFNSFGEFAIGKANKSALFLVGKVMITFKNTITLLQFIEGLAIVSAGTSQGLFNKATGFFGIASVSLKNLANGFELGGHGFQLLHSLDAWKHDIDQDGFQASLNWERGFEISHDVAKIAAVGLLSATGIWFESARFVALLGVSGVNIGKAVHEHFYPKKV